jgi:hypothetical protein
MRMVILGYGVVVGLCWLSGGVTPAQGKKPSVITSLGEHKLFDGKLIVKAVEGDGKLTITAIFGEKDSVATSWPTMKGVFWLVYPETAKTLWYFRDPHLVRFERTPQGSFTTNFTGKDVAKKAPKAVVNALPKAVLDKLNGK